jgi:uncharacterized protein (DUF302 family)
MPIRIVIYGKQGDGAAYAAMAQIRTIVREMGADVSVQIVDDEQQLKIHGIDTPPAVVIDGVTVSIGYVPSRNEMQGYIRRREEMLQGTLPSAEL